MSGVVGPTMVSMELLLGVSTSQIALALVFSSVGYTSGSILAGLVYDRMNKELVFTFILILMGESFGPAAFWLNLYVYTICLVLSAIAMGMNVAGGQPYILTLWSGHRLKGSMIQMMHFVFSLGAAAGPLVTKPFLPDLSFIGENCTALATNFINSSLGQLRSQEISNASAPYCPDRTEVEDTVVTVRFAYVTVSLLLIIPITFFTIVLFLGRPSFRLPRRQKADRENQDETKPKEDVTAPKFRIRLLIGGFVLFLHYLPVESSPSNFLAVFAVKGLGWPNGHGSLIIFVSLAALGIGRGLSIPIIACLSPARMLMGLLGVTFVGAALLIFSPYHDTFVWVSAAVAGIGMGPFFATAYVWLSQYISITGRTSSIFVAASYLAGLANPYILGYLLDNHGHMALAYYEITVAASFLVTYIFLQIFVTRHSPKKSNANSEEHTDNGNELL